LFPATGIHSVFVQSFSVSVCEFESLRLICQFSS
jgi:hypothetical protein